jgi:hypothetical protein
MTEGSSAGDGGTCQFWQGTELGKFRVGLSQIQMAEKHFCHVKLKIHWNCYGKNTRQILL